METPRTSVTGAREFPRRATVAKYFPRPGERAGRGLGPVTLIDMIDVCARAEKKRADMRKKVFCQWRIPPFLTTKPAKRGGPRSEKRKRKTN